LYQGLLHAHSGLRYIILILLLFAIIKSFGGWFGKREFSKCDNVVALTALITMHVQLLIGIILYFISPFVTELSQAMKVPELRFWSVEHLGMMILAIVLITLGWALAKRALSDYAKHKRIAIFYAIGFVLIIAAIPWPFSQISRAWF